MQLDVPEDVRDAAYSELEDLAAACDKARIAALCELQRRDDGSRRTARDERIRTLPVSTQQAARWLVTKSNKTLMVIAGIVALGLMVIRVLLGGVGSDAAVVDQLQRQLDRAQAIRKTAPVSGTPTAEVPEAQQPSEELERVFGAK